MYMPYISYALYFIYTHIKYILYIQYIPYMQYNDTMYSEGNMIKLFHFTNVEKEFLISLEVGSWVPEKTIGLCPVYFGCFCLLKL